MWKSLRNKLIVFLVVKIILALTEEADEGGGYVLLHECVMIKQSLRIHF